ncbi:TIGR03009 domain-containing protein [Crateriforma spongiae]|uniref:TIGR03009 domain-containing protein n=1 Tax=Crateriforma spongiae TaxID=2724528 RepID=UPI0014485F67|nr:TIGR03009 domain-containing protein [Crateriforma spongiae]
MMRHATVMAMAFLTWHGMTAGFTAPAQTANQPQERIASASRSGGQQAPDQNEALAPFQLSAAEQARLDQILAAWEKQSGSTKTLECTFHRYHYDTASAPAGIYASASLGQIKYAEPDKGLFRVDQKVFYKGMEGGKPQHAAIDGQFGEHWVCNGKELLEFDRSNKECRIQALPPQLQGAGIIDSPLPFVFNLKANDIKQRYWVRQVMAPKPDLIMIEAWPKRQQDAAQYKLVQIVLQQDTFLPAGLVMYAPNYDARTAPHRDIYEFSKATRNGSMNRLSNFMNNFIPEKPPSDWKIHRDTFAPGN